LKTLLLTLFVLPAGLLAAPVPEVRVAVADFQSDRRVDQQVGGLDSGRALARILRADLAVLAPVTVVGRWGPEADATDVVRAVPPAEAKATGESLGATTLVSGQVLAGPAGPIMAAKVISATTGRTQGTLVQSVQGESVADLASRLAAQVAAVAMAQLGGTPGSWPAAAIVGTRQPGSHLDHDEVACVLDVDGRVVPDETAKWDQPQTLSPGLHEVYVRFYDGHRLMGHGFIFNALPGAHYRVVFERPADRKATVWISSADTGEPVTGKSEADPDLQPPAMVLMNIGPYGNPSLPLPAQPSRASSPARSH
jgi:hypothetical protein